MLEGWPQEWPGLQDARKALVNDFVLAIKDEKKNTIYGGAVKAPKALADVVESVAAAMYVDCNYRVQHLWQVYKSLLEPIVTYEDLEKTAPASKNLNTAN
ncbi:hypothetical protein QQ045_000214 [Rhodiola kirilowii]